jgi:hypothetical protein
MPNYFEEEDVAPGFELTDRTEMIRALQATDPDWKKPEHAVKLIKSSWRPDLVKGNTEVCHIHTIAGVGNAWKKRFKEALEAGIKVHVAAPLDLWYSSETLVELDMHEVTPIVLETNSASSSINWTATYFASIAELIALKNLKLDTDVVKQIGRRLFMRSFDKGNSDEVGRRFEDFISLLFSQVSYFQVYKRNFENKTEEIDLVLINRRVNERVLPNSPIVLVSAKNTKDSVGVRALSTLQVKMSNRRGMCKLGFLCASRHIAMTVSDQALRSSHEERVIVPLSGTQLKHLIDNAEKIDEEIERLVLEAALT